MHGFFTGLRNHQRSPFLLYRFPPPPSIRNLYQILPPDLCRRERRRTGAEIFLPPLSPAGGQGGRSPAAPAIPAPAGGGLPFSSPAYPAFTFFSAPLSPHPPSPVGKGENITLFRRGLRPRHPGIKPPAALTDLATQASRWRVRLLPRPPTLPSPFFLPPYPPTPLPRWGRGRILLYFAGGSAPGTPALNRLQHLPPFPYRCPETEPGRHRSQGTAFFRFCGEPWVQPRGCKGRSPLHKKTKSLPLPRRGRGLGGWGQKSKLKAWQAGDKAGTPSLRTPQRQEQPVPLGVQPPSPQHPLSHKWKS